MTKAKFTPLRELKRKNEECAPSKVKKSSIESYKRVMKTNIILFGVIFACISIPSTVFRTDNAIMATAAKVTICIIAINILLDQPN